MPTNIHLKSIQYGAEVQAENGTFEVAARGRLVDTNAAGEAAFDTTSEHAQNPEALLATAHASCFLSALDSVLQNRGHAPKALHVRSVVELGPADNPKNGYAVDHVDLAVWGELSDEAEPDWKAFIAEAEKVCPISGAIANATEIRPTAR